MLETTTMVFLRMRNNSDFYRSVIKWHVFSEAVEYVTASTSVYNHVYTILYPNIDAVSLADIAEHNDRITMES
jgi:hypothetical protein